MVRIGTAQYSAAADRRPPQLRLIRANELASTPALQKKLGIIGPVANIGFGLVLGAISLTFSPDVDLYGQPWLSPAYLLRSAVWMNLLLGVVNVLPALPLDGGRVFRGEFAKTRESSKVRALLRVSARWSHTD